MLQLFHEFDLFNTAFTLLHVGHIKDLKQFERNKLPCHLIERLKDKGKLTLAYRLYYLIISITSAGGFLLDLATFARSAYNVSLRRLRRRAVDSQRRLSQVYLTSVTFLTLHA